MHRIYLLIVALVLLSVVAASAQVRVRPYTRKDGTYVPGHYRSPPDSSPYNNYSYPGNFNPHTGKKAPGEPTWYLEPTPLKQYQDSYDSPESNRRRYLDREIDRLLNR